MPTLACPVLQTLVPTVVPGIIFGILGLLGFIFFSCWMCTQCCCHRPRLVPVAGHAQQQQQFISGSGETSAPHAAAPPKPSWRQRRWAQPGFLFKALLTALALTVFAISTWGLVESIQATNDTFSDLWDIVDAVEAKASAGFCGVSAACWVADSLLARVVVVRGVLVWLLNGMAGMLCMLSCLAGGPFADCRTVRHAAALGCACRWATQPQTCLF
jgi:hypothetical protein